jgi:hypothetical protein
LDKALSCLRVTNALSLLVLGTIGFDVDCNAFRACRGAEFLVNPTAKTIVANDDNYALAA